MLALLRAYEQADTIPLARGSCGVERPACLGVYRRLVEGIQPSAADRVGRVLNANGIAAAVISGRVRQEKRQKLLKRFHDGEVPVLVATDVAARGLHIPDVTHVFNFDLPQDAPDYVHRIGRTARLGARGEAISFACEDYAFHLPEIEEYIGYPIPMDSAGAELMPEITVPPPPKRDGRRGRPGKKRPRRLSGQQRGGRR